MNSPFIPEHMEGSFNLVEEMNGPRFALAWLRAQYAAPVTDALRAHAIRAADGSAALDSIRAANPFPRVSKRTVNAGGLSS